MFLCLEANPPPTTTTSTTTHIYPQWKEERKELGSVLTYRAWNVWALPSIFLTGGGSVSVHQTADACWHSHLRMCECETQSATGVFSCFVFDTPHTEIFFEGNQSRSIAEHWRWLHTPKGCLVAPRGSIILAQAHLQEIKVHICRGKWLWVKQSLCFSLLQMMTVFKPFYISSIFQ